MSLESKAETRLKLQLEDEYDSDYKKVCPNMEPILEEKWVPLVEAQKDKADAINKLEEEKNKEYAELEFAMAKAVKAEAERYGELYNRMETAKTIMQEIPAYKFNSLGWEMYDRKEIDEWCNRLYAALKFIVKERSEE
jgi:adenine C2-methylase RlmN of 23S rRNA A2503 and tRNA A37